MNQMTNNAQRARVILECLRGRSSGRHIAKYLEKRDKLYICSLGSSQGVLRHQKLTEKLRAVFSDTFDLVAFCICHTADF